MKGTLAAIFCAFLLLAAALWLRNGPEVEVIIPTGASAQRISEILGQNKVIRFPAAFKAMALFSRLDRSLKPGEYVLNEGMLSPVVLWKLLRGGRDYIRVTIPEGWRVEQIGERLENLDIAPQTEFVRYVYSRDWEGYLFPATYFLSKSMPAAKVARIMHEEFLDKVLPAFYRARASHPLQQVVILASIVEREAVRQDEKPVIASVYLNRLRKRMNLEADPTVQYALGYWKKGLTLEDLKYPSPFNTYLYGGLPPRPICNPGFASIAGVLYPQPTEALYFVADNTGGHTFSQSFENHLRAKSRAKQERDLNRRTQKTPNK
ncbi:MAG: endolytic transglycosylase MltG [Elusimicrobia bacterium]|nr:endolytic transglycosylase MltG [Elusimicrobiota bacterium]